MNKRLSIFRVQSMHHGEKVLAAHSPSLRQCIWKVNRKLRRLHHFRPEVLYRKLVVHWDVYVPDFFHREQGLLLGQYLFQPVFRNEAIGRKVQLNYKRQR